jgi:hypothetical protein
MDVMRRMNTSLLRWMSIAMLAGPACVAEGELPLAEEADADDDGALPPAGEDPAQLEQIDPGSTADVLPRTELAPDVAYYWTSYVTDGTPPVTCNNGHLLTGVDCSGSYCDNKYLECESASTTMTTRSWTSYFSEESTSYRYCGSPTSSSYVSGMSCIGSYCDKISLECTVTGFGAPTSCLWSGYFSEEDPPFQAPAGRFIKGVQCAGSYCDSVRFYYCVP